MADTIEATRGTLPDPTAPFEESWVLVGAVGSGKTFFLNIAMTQKSAEATLRKSETGIANFDFINVDHDDTYMMNALRIMANEAVPPATSGAVRAHDFQVKLEVDSSKLAADELPQPLSNRRVRIVDGPGGLLIGNESQADLAKRADGELATAYRQAAHDATGLIICLPVAGRSVMTGEEETTLKRLLELIQLGRAKNLRRVAVCLTKYEARFVKYGADAHKMAQDPENLYAIWRDFPSRANLHEALRDIGSVREDGTRIDVRFFPVSAYGFIGNTGYTNLETGSGLPMVLQPRNTRRVTKYDIPLYPEKFDPAVVSSLSTPFNVCEPLAFLAGGTARGMLNLHIDEMNARIEGPEPPIPA